MISIKSGAVGGSSYRAFGSELSLIHKCSDGWSTFRDLLSRIPYVDRSTAEPEVFRYGSHELDWGWLYQFTFYGGFVVNAWMLREDGEGPHNAGIESGQGNTTPAKRSASTTGAMMM